MYGKRKETNGFLVFGLVCSDRAWAGWNVPGRDFRVGFEVGMTTARCGGPRRLTPQ